MDCEPEDKIATGLTELLRATPRGRQLTHRQIADACGCSMQLIWQLERQAMKKLRARLIAAGLRDAL